MVAICIRVAHYNSVYGADYLWRCKYKLKRLMHKNHPAERIMSTVEMNTNVLRFNILYEKPFISHVKNGISITKI